MAKNKKKRSGEPENAAPVGEEIAAAAQQSIADADAEASIEMSANEPAAPMDEVAVTAEDILTEITVENAAAVCAETVEPSIETKPARDDEDKNDDAETEVSDEETLAEMICAAEETEAAITIHDDSAASDPVPMPPERDVTAIKETLGEVLDTCESVMIAVFVVLLIFTYLFSIAIVQGDSMLPTLRADDRLLLVNFSSPEPGDVVVLDSRASYVFDSEGNLQEGSGLGKKIVKRLIATENQVVDIDFSTGIVYVDGVALEENYTMTLTTRDEGAFQYPITVPEGYVFVLGDNRSVSKDSRHPDVGLISEDDIVGKVWLRIYPFSDVTAVG